MCRKTLHISGCRAVIPDFIRFVGEHFSMRKHEFFLTNGMAEEQVKHYHNVFVYNRTVTQRLVYYYLVIVKMHKSKKIVLHGLFDIILVFILFFSPWLLKKCYWIIWGGDLYLYQLAKPNWKWKVNEFFRRHVIKNIGFLVTGTSGDVELAKKWYGANGKHIKCFNYPSNMSKEYDLKLKKDSHINILVGNSADKENNHLEVFDKLEVFKEQNIKIFTPLTYGDNIYAQEVIKEGGKRFGDKFQAITQHAPLNKYIEFLNNIDIAIFNHKRQQALGNTITLLGLGKKIYLNQKSTLNNVFKEYNIAVYDIDEINISLLDKDTSTHNIKKIKKYFSKESLFKSLSKWIE